MRLWDTIRNTTLESQAPALIYEEGELVKRAIRDIYDRDTTEVVVEGEEGYKRAREIMKMMIPSHVKRVKEHKTETTSLFQKYQLEDQISGIGETTVQLKSGGYLVIQQTEALVSIDVNSGRATKERHIEETALRTNLESAVEVARQLRLRDMGGLVVIDFIDMEDRRNNGKVERKLKEALSSDRARLQVGRISSFGLLELSRQRISASVNETQFQKCPHCDGGGVVRTVDSLAIIVLRAIESAGIEGKAAEVTVKVTPEVALYLLNRKRHRLISLEERFDLKVIIDPDAETSPSSYELNITEPKRNDAQDDGDDEDQSQSDKNTQDDEKNSKQQRNNKSRNNRRNQRGRGRNRKQDDDQQNNEEQSSDQDNQTVSDDKADHNDENAKDEKPKRTRRSSRSKTKKVAEDQDSDASSSETTDKPQDKNTSDDVKDEKPKAKSSRGRGRKKKDDSDVEQTADEASNTDKAEDEKPKKKSSRAKKEKAVSEPSNDVGDAEASEPDQTHAREQEVVNEPPKSKKKGWWSRSS